MPTETNPVLARLTRGEKLESLHRGTWALVATSGEVIAHAGDPQQRIFPRSATKSIQALPLVESGTADTLGFTDEELALAVASHNGELVHAETAAAMLAKAGLGPEYLKCGPQAPAGSGVDGEARAITNNCSGKHAAFLATALTLGDDPSIYLSPHSSLQLAIHQAMADMTGTPASELGMGIDGCSAPTFELPLAALARGIAQMTNPADQPQARADACHRIVHAATTHPEMVAGTTPRRFDTDLMQVTGGRVFAKGGAEGVQTFGVIGAGVGFAAKMDDGTTRSLHRITMQVLIEFGYLTPEEQTELSSWSDPVLRNYAGLDVGTHTLT